jgi:hypothetical protein
MGRIGSSETPDYIASSVSDVGANAVSTLVDIINQSLFKYGYKLLDPLR